jgi:hypothetical protein
MASGVQGFGTHQGVWFFFCTLLLFAGGAATITLINRQNRAILPHFPMWQRFC